MNDKVIIITVIIFILIFVIETLLGINIKNKLGKSLLDNDIATFDKVRNKKITKFLIPRVSLYFYDLNKALAIKDDDLIDSIVARLENLKLSNDQKKTVYSTVFYHYLHLEDKDKIKPYYEKLSEITKDSISEEDVLYDVYILKGYKYLDFVEDMYKKATGDKKLSIEALLAAIYKNKGDNEKRDFYLKKVKEGI